MKQVENVSLMKVLNGIGLAIAISLIPGALLGELATLIAKHNDIGIQMLNSVNFCTRMLPLVIGLCIAHQHGLDTIQSAAVGFSAAIGSGVIVSVEKGVHSLAGTGDVINAALVAALATWIIIKFCRPLKSLSVVIVPTLVPLITGAIGLLTLPHISLIARSIGNTINYFTTLQPVLMGALIAMSFTIIIVSPISTVAIAYSIGIVGIASASANIGVSVAGVVLALLGYKTNTIGTIIATLMGTPKIQMANFIKKPIMLLPCLIISGLLGMYTGIAEFHMPTTAAGFGVIGFIGPIALMNHLGWNVSSAIITLMYFVVVPLGVGFVLQKVFKKHNLIEDNDYKLEY